MMIPLLEMVTIQLSDMVEELIGEWVVQVHHTEMLHTDRLQDPARHTELVVVEVLKIMVLEELELLE